LCDVVPDTIVMDRRRYSLARAITITLAVKFVALGVIWSFWFSDPESRRLDPAGVAATVYSPPPVAHEPGLPHAEP
jgi:hypothetical protein